MPTSNGLDISTLSASDVESLLAQLRDVKKDLRDADNARLGELVREFVETIVVERPMEASEKSGWHGIKVHGLPLVVAGVKVTFSGTITDTEATEAGKAALKAAGETPADEPEASDETAAEPAAEPVAA